MRNNSIETLLLRHYGSNAPLPADLEQQLLTSLRQKSQQRVQARRLSRRQVVRLVALSSAGVGILSAGLEGLQTCETIFFGQETQRPALS